MCLKFRHVQKVRSHFLQKYCCNYLCDFYISHEVYSKHKYICTLRTEKGFFVDHNVNLYDTRPHKGEVTNGAVKRLISSVNHSVHINRMYFKFQSRLSNIGCRSNFSLQCVTFFLKCFPKIFKASALWADAFYKSKCPSVCPCVRLFVHF